MQIASLNASSSSSASRSAVQVIIDANQLLADHAALILRVRTAQKENRQQLYDFSTPPTELIDLPLIPSPTLDSPTIDGVTNEHGYGDDDWSEDEEEEEERPIRQDLPPAKRARALRYKNYVPEEETIRNDYSQRYVDGGEWPQNWVLGAEPEHRFEEYPKQQRLLNLKKASVNTHSLPPSYIPFSELTSLHPSKFDVILIDPPFSSTFTWDHLQELPIPSLASDPSFVFLWVGSGAGEGLERGREILAKWGYRRAEDVVWVRTNKTTNKGPGTDPPTTSLLTRTKQHCLMGIRGTVRRSTDSWFVHCNVDTDVIIWEGDPTDPTRKPPEMYTLIENFCLGLRRLEVFGKLSSLRRGWVTALAPGQEQYIPSDGAVGVDYPPEVEAAEGGGSDSMYEGLGLDSRMRTAHRWVQQTWEEGIKEIGQRATSAAANAAPSAQAGGVNVNQQGVVGSSVPVPPPARPVVPMTAEIDALRPKSPVRPGQGGGGQGGGGMGMGGGAIGGGVGMGGTNMNMNMNMGGGGMGNATTIAVPMSMGARFSGSGSGSGSSGSSGGPGGGGRASAGVNGQGQGQGQGRGRGQQGGGQGQGQLASLMAQPMHSPSPSNMGMVNANLGGGMAGMGPMGGMGMNPLGGVGMGGINGVGMSMEDMMPMGFGMNVNPMMGMNVGMGGMGGMNVNNMTANLNNRGINGIANNLGVINPVGGGMPIHLGGMSNIGGMNMNNMAAMNMNGMNMMGMQGMNGAAEGQFGAMDGTWDAMGGVGMPGMGMQSMGMGNMGMNMNMGGMMGNMGGMGMGGGMGNMGNMNGHGHGGHGF